MSPPEADKRTDLRRQAHPKSYYVTCTVDIKTDTSYQSQNRDPQGKRN